MHRLSTLNPSINFDSISSAKCEMTQCASTGNLSTNSHVKRKLNAPIDENDKNKTFLSKANEIPYYFYCSDFVVALKNFSPSK